MRQTLSHNLDTPPRRAERARSRLLGAKWLNPVRNAGTLSLGRGAKGILSLASAALAARTLGMEDYGILVLLHGFVLVVGEVARFQSSHMLQRYGAAALADDDPKRFRRTVEFSILLDLLSVLIGLLIVVSAIAPAAGAFGIAPEWHELARLYGLGVVLMMLGGTPGGVLLLFDRFDLLATQITIAPVIRAIGAGVLFMMDAGLLEFLVVWFVAMALGRLTLIFMGYRELARRGRLTGLRPLSTGIRQPETGAWRFALGTNVNSSLTLAQSHIGMLAVGWLLGPAAAGLFHVAQRFAHVLIKPIRTLFVPAVYAELVHLTARNKHRARRRVAGRTSILTGILAAVLFAALVAFGESLIAWIMGQAFVEAYTTMVLLAVAGLVEAWTFSLDPLLVSTGKVRTVVLVRSVASAVYLACLYALVTSVGLEGAGLAAVIYAVMAGGGLLPFGLHVLRAERKGTPGTCAPETQSPYS